MDQRAFHQLQHVDLRVACRVIYAKVNGASPDDRGLTEAILDDVAHAISNVITVYATELGSHAPIAITPYELVGGKFIEGGHRFRAKDGTEKDALTIQRGDMYSAISILRSAKITFGRPVTGQPQG